MKNKTEEEVRLRENIRLNLIQCRQSANLTQTDVGNLIGRTKGAVASWEQGKSLPDVQSLYLLARHYGKTLEYMYGEYNEKEE